MIDPLRPHWPTSQRTFAGKRTHKGSCSYFMLASYYNLFIFAHMICIYIYICKFIVCIYIYYTHIYTLNMCMYRYFFCFLITNYYWHGFWTWSTKKIVFLSSEIQSIAQASRTTRQQSAVFEWTLPFPGKQVDPNHSHSMPRATTRSKW